MGTICLSLAPILRCQSLNRIQSAVLFIPPAVEIMFSVTLVVAKKGKDRDHLFLAGEGLAYAMLTLLDLLTHLLPGVSNNLVVFKALDIFVGALSFVPLLLFSLFLLRFTTREIIPSLPKRFQQVVKYTLTVLPFFVVLFNQLGSFLTISYRDLDHAGKPIIAVGFTNPTVRSFMDGLVLVLFVIFQALNFCGVFLRLVKAFLNQRQIDITDRGADNQAHLFNGLGWIAAGIKLGAVEGLIGFAAGGFGEALTRRILRFLGRACLIIGVLKGVDTVEDFRLFRFHEKNPRRRSALLALISNPRNSTFQQIGGYDFHPGMVIPAAIASITTVPIASPLLSPNRTLNYGEKSRYSEIKFTSPLVSIRRGRGRAPTLELSRISDLNFLSPFRSTFDRTSSRTSSINPEKPRPHSALLYTFPSMASALTSPSPALIGNRHTMAGVSSEYSRHKPKRSSVTLPNRTSAVSTSSDSFAVVRSLANQFPGIPPRVTPASRQSTIDDALKLMEAEEELYPVVGVSRTMSDRSSKSGLVRRSSSVKRKPVPKPKDRSQDESVRGFPHLSAIPHGHAPIRTPAASEDVHTHDVLPPPSPVSPNMRRYTSPETHVVTDFDNNFRTERETASVGGSPQRRSEKRAARIKSVGSVPRRRTPVPTQTFTRESAVAEWFRLSHKSPEDVDMEGSDASTIVSLSDERVRQSMRSLEAGESYIDYR
ncbi:hypothetical protein EUX98_g3697 [Antrodiella citrinella]|uniref:Uncharacterized protein n=1 Tax=Antrodiella citrinella TaxID=2447956 RepID=A0A4S4MVV8_9APHY|nr:hypothetical protein EUX98_g3697 [Antrodiella citrinella]